MDKKKVEKKFIISETLLKKKPRKHHKSHGWRKVYLYKNHKKYNVAKKMENEELIIDNVQEVREDVLYKDNKKSKADQVWDWYKILKISLKGDVVQKKDDRGSKIGGKKVPKCPYTKKPIDEVKIGPIILDFD
jgi:hypothetical protein